MYAKWTESVRKVERVVRNVYEMVQHQVLVRKLYGDFAEIWFWYANGTKCVLNVRLNQVMARNGTDMGQKLYVKMC